MSNFECESLTITGESLCIIEIYERITRSLRIRCRKPMRNSRVNHDKSQAIYERTTMEPRGASEEFLCLRLCPTPVTYFAECQ